MSRNVSSALSVLGVAMLASAAALALISMLVALTACSGKPQAQSGTLDLGGGISMTANGEILGATPHWPASLPPEQPGDVQANGPQPASPASIANLSSK